MGPRELGTQLVGTGVFALAPGTYGSQPSYIDGGPRTLELRRNGVTLRYVVGEGPPPSLRDAYTLVAAFVERARRGE